MNNFSWIESVQKALFKTFPGDYSIEALQLLNKNLENEFQNGLQKKNRKSLEHLFSCLKEFYNHFCWKINWKKESFNMKYSCVKILSLLIQTGICLSKGNVSSKWIDTIFAAVKMFHGTFDQLCDAFILVINLKKRNHQNFAFVLRHILFSKQTQVEDPSTYFKILLLLRRLKFLTNDSLKKAEVVNLAYGMCCPPDSLFWLSKHGLLDYSKCSRKVLAKRLFSKKGIKWVEKLREIFLCNYVDATEFVPTHYSNDIQDLFVIDSVTNAIDDLSSKEVSTPNRKITSKNQKRKSKAILVDKQSCGDACALPYKKRRKISNGESFSADQNLIFTSNDQSKRLSKNTEVFENETSLHSPIIVNKGVRSLTTDDDEHTFQNLKDTGIYCDTDEKSDSSFKDVKNEKPISFPKSNFSSVESTNTENSFVFDTSQTSYASFQENENSQNAPEVQKNHFVDEQNKENSNSNSSILSLKLQNNKLETVVILPDHNKDSDSCSISYLDVKKKLKIEHHISDEMKIESNQKTQGLSSSFKELSEKKAVSKEIVQLPLSNIHCIEHNEPKQKHMFENNLNQHQTEMNNHLGSEKDADIGSLISNVELDIIEEKDLSEQQICNSDNISEASSTSDASQVISSLQLFVETPSLQVVSDSINSIMLETNKESKIDEKSMSFVDETSNRSLTLPKQSTPLSLLISDFVTKSEENELDQYNKTDEKIVSNKLLKETSAVQYLNVTHLNSQAESHTKDSADCDIRLNQSKKEPFLEDLGLKKKVINLNSETIPTEMCSSELLNLDEAMSGASKNIKNSQQTVQDACISESDIGNEAVGCELDNSKGYIENVLNKLVNKVAHRLDDAEESSFEFLREKILKEDLTPCKSYKFFNTDTMFYSPKIKRQPFSLERTATSLTFSDVFLESPNEKKDVNLLSPLRDLKGDKFHNYRNSRSTIPESPICSVSKQADLREDVLENISDDNLHDDSSDSEYLQEESSENPGVSEDLNFSFDEENCNDSSISVIECKIENNAILPSSKSEINEESHLDLMNQEISDTIKSPDVSDICDSKKVNSNPLKSLNTSTLNDDEIIDNPAESNSFSHAEVKFDESKKEIIEIFDYSQEPQNLSNKELVTYDTEAETNSESETIFKKDKKSNVESQITDISPESKCESSTNFPTQTLNEEILIDDKATIQQIKSQNSVLLCQTDTCNQASSLRSNKLTNSDLMLADALNDNELSITSKPSNEDNSLKAISKSDVELSKKSKSTELGKFEKLNSVSLKELEDNKLTSTKCDTKDAVADSSSSTELLSIKVNDNQTESNKFDFIAEFEKTSDNTAKENNLESSLELQQAKILCESNSSSNIQNKTDNNLPMTRVPPTVSVINQDSHQVDFQLQSRISKSDENKKTILSEADVSVNNIKEKNIPIQSGKEIPLGLKHLTDAHLPVAKITQQAELLYQSEELNISSSSASVPLRRGRSSQLKPASSGNIVKKRVSSRLSKMLGKDDVSLNISSDLSKLTLTSTNKKKISSSKQNETKAFKTDKFSVQKSVNTETKEPLKSAEGYNLRSKKPLILPGKLKIQKDKKS